MVTAVRDEPLSLFSPLCLTHHLMLLTLACLLLAYAVRLARAFQTSTPPEDDELTEESLAAFVASWDAGELETKEFNLPTKAEGEEGGAEGTSE